MGGIRILAHCPCWADAFAREKDVLESMLSPLGPRIHHIGSTAVPGLFAKPTIDILIEIEDLERIDAYSASFEARGYQVMGAFGIAGRRYFQKGDHSHHVHVFSTGDKNLIRHLAFRDYLRAFPGVARAYGELKKRMAASCGGCRSTYCAGKDGFIKHHEEKAMAWYGRGFPL